MFQTGLWGTIQDIGTTGKNTGCDVNLAKANQNSPIYLCITDQKSRWVISNILLPFNIFLTLKVFVIPHQITVLKSAL